jgi:glycerate dehydrogenase
MKIVVTDGHTLNPGDLSWEQVKEFGEVEVYKRMPAELIAERCRNAEIVITNYWALSVLEISASG